MTDPAILTSLPASVRLSRHPSSHRWQNYRWRLDWVLIGDIAVVNPAPAPASGDGERAVTHGDLSLTLYKDEAESYYHNLMAPTPSLFVVTRRDDSDEPVPFRVTASFDEAHAYAEGDDEAHALPLPAALCELLETYVLQHYAPEPRKKRKRQNWHEDPRSR